MPVCVIPGPRWVKAWDRQGLPVFDSALAHTEGQGRPIPANSPPIGICVKGGEEMRKREECP